LKRSTASVHRCSRPVGFTALLTAVSLFIGITMVIGDHYLLESFGAVQPSQKDSRRDSGERVHHLFGPILPPPSDRVTFCDPTLTAPGARARRPFHGSLEAARRRTRAESIAALGRSLLWASALGDFWPAASPAAP